MTSVLDAGLAEFLQSGVAIVAATRDAANVPALTRGGGCRVSGDGQTLTIYVATDQAWQCLDNVRATGSIAVVFALPTNYESYQLKGVDARVVAIDEQDRERVRTYRSAFFGNLAKIGMPEKLSAGLLPDAPEGFVGLMFTPTDLFRQTPGPGAGDRPEQ